MSRPHAGARRRSVRLRLEPHSVWQDVLAQLRAKTVDDIHGFVTTDRRTAKPLMPALETPAAVISGAAMPHYAVDDPLS